MLHLLKGQHTGNNPNFIGTWVNDLGSKMVIDSINGNSISGKYFTNVGAPDPSDSFDMIGFFSGDIVSFTVNFGVHGSLTAWVGQHTSDESGIERIKTMWHLVKNISDENEPTSLWSTVITGHNEFTRT